MFKSQMTRPSEVRDQIRATTRPPAPLLSDHTLTSTLTSERPNSPEQDAIPDLVVERLPLGVNGQDVRQVGVMTQVRVDPV